MICVEWDIGAGIQHTGLAIRPGFKSQPCHLTSSGFGASYLAHMFFRYHVYEMALTMCSFPRVVMRTGLVNVNTAWCIIHAL